MSNNRVILVTGVADYWGRRVALRLLEEPGVHVIGLDTEAPQGVDGLDFVQADVRNPLLPDLLRTEQVDTVVHLAFVEQVNRSETIFDYNVMGAMKVIGAAAESDVSHVILKSSAMVYGAHADNAAFLTEDTPLRGSRRYGYNHCRLEIESFINGFRRTAPDLPISVLRFANIVGPSARTPFTTYLRAKLPPILLGFDPMMQVVHEDDVVEALAHAAGDGTPGIYNIAAGEPLPLLRILGLVGRLPVPVVHPLATRCVAWFGGKRVAQQMPLEPSYLRFRWTVDTTVSVERFGFTPQASAVDAITSIGRGLRLKRYERDEADNYDETRLRATLARRRRRRAAEESYDG